jgi:hypothetical protein
MELPCKTSLRLLTTLLGMAACAFAQQTPTPTPPRSQKFVELKPGAAVAEPTSKEARAALAIKPEKWRTAETDNFIIHYRRMTEAQKVVREIEFDLWFIAQSLGVDPSRYAKKSHVLIFEDEKEWKAFLAGTSAPPWSASFANGDDLYLNIRGPNGTGFDSGTLAHETTHAVVSRIYLGALWPVWLNEGFAEYMSGASVAARKNQTVKRHQEKLHNADMPLDEMFALKEYPDQADVPRLYQTSEMFVRFLFTELPKERFAKFADAVTSGQPPKSAFTAVYGDKIKDWETFLRRYERFAK